jgi:hypothetical protein
MKSIAQSLAAKLHPVYCWGPLLIAVILYAGNIAAKPVGTVVNLSDPSQLLAKQADGKVKVLNLKSTVESGDVLESQGSTYARIKFIDGSEITLSPNTQFRIDHYAFDKDNQKDDSSIFTLIKGTLRSVSGTLGKRSNDRYKLNTPAATIGIRGTSYLAKYLPKDELVACQIKKKEEESSSKSASDQAQGGSENGGCGDFDSGLYVEVIGGVIYVANDGGTQVYTAGQYGYASTFQQAPVVLANNPGIVFNPPSRKSGAIECSVR